MTPTGKFYSVAFETELASALYPVVSRYMHFKEVNDALDAAMKTNPMLGQLESVYQEQLLDQ